MPSDFQFDHRGKTDCHGVAFNKENLNFLSVFQKALHVCDEFLIERDGLVSGEIHEMGSGGIGVGEFQLLASRFHDVDLLGGGESNRLFVA